jgi:hypothetical protein
MKLKKDKITDENPEVKSLKDVLQMVEITPEKDFHIVHNQWNIELKEGVPVPIPRIFLKNMVTEGVIKKIPTT